mmetsp:Transcript_9636/g.20178  ORF Transcript_9636/g.20178 Transcript_9636/m.20178 type:complete len:199 (+) Transcript_9636:132-728(+)
MKRLIVPTNITINIGLVTTMILLLFTTSTIIVDTFAFTTVSTSYNSRTTATTATKMSLFAKPRSRSPLVDEALEAYPYSFEGRRAMVTREQAGLTFNELARLYGDDEALTMVKLEPRVLVFNSDNYAPCLEAWTEQFGLEAAKGMVGRNPNLLAVRPSLAQKPAEDSMFFSYVIAASRPLPKILAAGLLLSIATAGMQ